MSTNPVSAPQADWIRELEAKLRAAEAQRDRLRAALEPLREQLHRFRNAGTQYSRCALYLDGSEMEALARVALGED